MQISVKFISRSKRVTNHALYLTSQIISTLNSFCIMITCTLFKCSNNSFKTLVLINVIFTNLHEWYMLNFVVYIYTNMCVGITWSRWWLCETEGMSTLKLLPPPSPQKRMESANFYPLKNSEGFFFSGMLGTGPWVRG